MSLRLCGIRTQYCALFRGYSTQEVQSVYDAGYSHLKGAESNAPGASPFLLVGLITILL